MGRLVGRRSRRGGILSPGTRLDLALATGKADGGRECPAVVWHLAGSTDDLVKQQSARTHWLQKPEPLLAPTALEVALWGSVNLCCCPAPGIHRKSSCEKFESGTVNLGDRLTWL